MSFIEKMQNRMVNKRANKFIKSLASLSESDAKKAYLDNKDLQNNEIVLSCMFFKHPELISILPLEFQISRLNSNLNMFEYGSTEAKRELVSSWLKDNKFFTNANAIKFLDGEYESFIKLYFNQPKDVAKLFMVDMKNVISVLSETDIRKTEEIIMDIKDELTDRQWEFVIEACPLLIKYASQTIQSKYAEDEKYNKFINGEAREKFVSKQIEMLKTDISLIHDMSIDIQCDFIRQYPYMINSVDNETLIKLLQYDINLIKNVNISSLKNSKDNSLDVIIGLISNIETFSIREIINIAINKGLLNARGKLYRFDKTSNNSSYQYIPKILEIIQKLSIEQMCSLITIDVNYVLAYVAPVFYSDYSADIKEKVILDCNSRCLELFKAYFGQDMYDNYYKVINKIFNEYLSNYNKYDYTKDYYCLLDLLKVLFNKNIINKNSVEKVTVFIGMSLLYKTYNRKLVNSPTIKLLNELINNAYDINVDNSFEIYEINSLELFDNKLDFISPLLISKFNEYNFVNISSLLFIIKSNKVYELFKKYYKIVISIHNETIETLFKACESFHYYIDILRNIEGKDLTSEQENNLIELLATYTNDCDVHTLEELSNYKINKLKKLVSNISGINNDSVSKNLICNYLFNMGYNQKGNFGMLETETIKVLLDVYDEGVLSYVEVDGSRLFSDFEMDLFKTIKLMFSVSDSDLLFSYLDSIISKSDERNIIAIIDMFNKFKEYKMDIINNQIVTLDELDMLCNSSPSIARKSMEKDVEVYTIIGQDFKVLCSNNNDGIHYFCSDVSNIKKNCYGYNSFSSIGHIRLVLDELGTTIKVNKDLFQKPFTRADYILVPIELNDDILKIAKDNNLKVVVVRE